MRYIPIYNFFYNFFYLEYIYYLCGANIFEQCFFIWSVGIVSWHSFLYQYL